MAFHVAQHHYPSAPKTANDFLEELRRPGSPYQKKMNFALNEIIREEVFIESLFFFWGREVAREKSELAELLAEVKEREAEKFSDVLAPPSLATNDIHMLTQEEPSLLREVLEKALELGLIFSQKWQIAREVALRDYLVAHQALVENMARKAIETPLTTADGSVVDVRQVLENAVPVERLVKVLANSLIEAAGMTEDPPDLTHPLRPVLTPFSLVPSPPAAKRKEEEVIQTFTKRVNVLTELQLLFAAASVGGNLHGKREEQSASRMVAAQRRAGAAITNIMSPAMQGARHLRCLENLVAVEAGCRIVDQNNQKIQDSLEQLAENTVRRRP